MNLSRLVLVVQDDESLQGIRTACAREWYEWERVGVLRVLCAAALELAQILKWNASSSLHTE